MKKIFSMSLLFILAASCVFAEPLTNAASDEARLGALLAQGNQSYEKLHDYTAIFYKKEKSKGAIGEDEEIYLKFEKPWKIYMGWLSSAKKGLQVVYERGKHRGKLAIHKPGLGLGLVPVIFLDQKSPWVREGSESYDIEDAGIGNFLEDFSAAVARASKEGKLKIKFLGRRDENGITGEKVEVIFDNTVHDDDYFAYRILTVFDEMTGLPVGMSLYDWENKLIGTYEYRKLRVNNGNDEEFKKQINRHLFRVFSPKGD